MDSQLIVFVNDRFGNPLPGAEVSFWTNGDFLGKVLSEGAKGRASFQVAQGIPIEISVQYNEFVHPIVKLPGGTSSFVIQLDVRGGYSPMKPYLAGIALLIGGVALLVGLVYLGGLADLVPLVVGGVLLAVSLGLAFLVRDQTPLQQQLIRSLFALALGGIASAVPGILEVNLNLETKATIAASGAIAVWLVTYFFAPARDI